MSTLIIIGICLLATLVYILLICFTYGFLKPEMYCITHETGDDVSGIHIAPFWPIFWAILAIYHIWMLGLNKVMWPFINAIIRVCSWFASLGEKLGERYWRG